MDPTWDNYIVTTVKQDNLQDGTILKYKPLL